MPKASNFIPRPKSTYRYFIPLVINIVMLQYVIMSLSKSNESRGRQWLFVIPTPNDEALNNLLNRLVNLPQEEVLYWAFSTIHDDTGSTYVEGFIKINYRVRVAFLVRLIGYGFFDVCSTSGARNVLLKIKTNSSFQEFGNTQEIVCQGSRNDLANFKVAMDAGLTLEQLGALYPQICSRYPNFVNNCLIKANRLNPVNEVHDEILTWLNNNKV